MSYLTKAQLNELKELYWLYEMNGKTKKYIHSADELLLKYRLRSINALQALFREHNLGQPIGVCEFCEEEFFVYSRAMARQAINFPCNHIGMCKGCQSEPITRFSAYCPECLSDKYESDFSLRMIAESKVVISDFTPSEVKALSYIKANWSNIFIDGKLSEAKLSFGLKCSLNAAHTIWKVLLSKFAITVNLIEMEYYVIGVNERLDIPEWQNESALNIISSPLAQQTFRKLQEHYDYVFPEISFAAFAKLDDISNCLTESERRGFFTKRLDFICANQDFEVVAAIEYNGRHHFASDASKETRRFKRKVCDLLGLPFIEINSPSQIDHRINELSLITDNES